MYFKSFLAISHTTTKIDPIALPVKISGYISLYKFHATSMFNRTSRISNSSLVLQFSEKNLFAGGVGGLGPSILGCCPETFWIA